MKKLDPKELCASFNKARLQNQGTTFPIEELKKVLKSFGISSYLVSRMRKLNMFNTRLISGRKYYMFSDTPIYVSQFMSLLSKKNMKHVEKFTEEEAIAYLKKKGYRVQKPTIDWDLLFKENPEIVEKYTSWK